MSAGRPIATAQAVMGFLGTIGIAFGVSALIDRHRPADPPAAAPPAQPIMHRLPDGPRVWEVTLSDGTPCAVSSAGGITCGWLWDDGADPGYEDAAEMGPPAPGGG